MCTANFFARHRRWIMPRMGGQELSHRLRETRPTLKVVCCSGYTDEEIVKSRILTEGAAFLQKPYTPSLLALKVRQTLDNTEAG